MSKVERLLRNASRAVIGYLLLSMTASAQGALGHLGRDRASDQQGCDRYECHVWAIRQSGFDPLRQLAQKVVIPLYPPKMTATPDVRCSAWYCVATARA